MLPLISLSGFLKITPFSVLHKMTISKGISKLHRGPYRFISFYWEWLALPPNVGSSCPERRLQSVECCSWVLCVFVYKSVLEVIAFVSYNLDEIYFDVLLCGKPKSKLPPLIYWSANKILCIHLVSYSLFHACFSCKNYLYFCCVY